MISPTRTLPRAALLGAAVLLGACASLASPADEPTLSGAQAAYARGDYAAASIDYESVARSAAEPFSGDYWLLAADCALRAGDGARAEQLLKRIPATALDAHQQARLQLLRARTALQRNDPAAALQALPDAGSDDSLADAILQVRAQALYKTGATAAATAALVQREHLLSAPKALQDNRAAIWAGVSSAPPADPRSLASADPTTRGWLELGALAQLNPSLAALDNWHRRYPDHPGNAYLAQLMMPAGSHPAATAAASPGGGYSNAAPAGGAYANGLQPLVAGAGPVALLLPLGGPLAAAGVSVRTGFGTAIPSQVYDTGGTPEGAVAAYRRAVSEGAGLAVGPLVKDAEQAIAANPLPIPVLALNYLDPGARVPAGLWQFGLAPEDEAVAAADDAYARGLRSAVALAPTGDWGDRVLDAFRARLTALGGSLVDTARYTNGMNDFGDPIRSILRLNAADDRARALTATLGVKPEFTAEPRSDIDFIFVAARAAKARLIVPQLRYYRADTLPIYATSAAYDGSGGFDLDGLRVCDVPALIQSGSAGGQAVDVVRLSALGQDSAQLVQQLRSSGLGPDTHISGATGKLSVDAGGVIHRQLNCAAISGSSLQPLQPLP